MTRSRKPLAPLSNTSANSNNNQQNIANNAPRSDATDAIMKDQVASANTATATAASGGSGGSGGSGATATAATAATAAIAASGAVTTIITTTVNTRSKKRKENDSPANQKTKALKVEGKFHQNENKLSKNNNSNNSNSNINNNSNNNNNIIRNNRCQNPSSLAMESEEVEDDHEETFLPKPIIKISKDSNSKVDLTCNEPSIGSPLDPRNPHQANPPDEEIVECSLHASISINHDPEENEGEDGSEYLPTLEQIDTQKHREQRETYSRLSFHPTGTFLRMAAGLVGDRVVDIDAGREASPLHCTGYVRDIYANARRVEDRFRPIPLNYLAETQKDEITPEMRATLMDWLVDVTEEFKLSTETLFLTKAYTDVFLSVVKIDRSMLQLVGITALLIAAKYEEVSPPTIDDLVYISDRTYTRQQVLEMELNMLNKLKYNLAVPTEKMFLRRYQRAAAANIENRSLLNKIAMFSSFLAELTLQEYQFLAFKPSVIAAACVALSLFIFNARPWSATLTAYTQLAWEDRALQACMETLYDTWRQSRRSNLKAVYEKYANPRFLNISTLPAPNHGAQF